MARVSDELQRAVARLPGASGRDASREGELRGEGKLRVVRGRGPAGISNRPPREERREQADLPPRGTARNEAEPALRPRREEHPAPRDPGSRAPATREPPPLRDDPEPPAPKA